MIAKEITDYINKGKLVIFCGAGVSFNSGLPLANPFKEFILSQLKIEASLINSMLRSSLPFESFIETILTETNSTEFLKIYEKGTPNANHFFMAKLAKCKKVKLIVTTNFDLLIEKALHSEGLTEGKDFIVYYKEEDFKKIKWNTSKIILIKIHGSVQNKRQMGATLIQITKRNLTISKQKIIEHIFSKGKHSCVLMLGYSCSDIFDITPQITALKNKSKKIYLVEHAEKKAIRLSSLGRKLNSPFHNYRNAKAIKVNTDVFIERIWSETISEKFAPIKAANVDWRNSSRNWINKVSKKNASVIGAIIGMLNYKIGEYNNALKYFQTGLRKAKTDFEKAIHYSNVGIAYGELGQYKKSIAFNKKSLSLSAKLRKWKRYISSLNNIAYIYSYAGEIDTALKYQTDSLKRARKIQDEELLYINYNNLGNLNRKLKDYKTAYENYCDALEIVKVVGHKQWEGTILNNIGLVNKLKGHCKKSLANHIKALQIAVQIGNKAEECRSLENIGQIYFTMKKYADALCYFKKALRITNEYSFGKGKRIVSKALAKTYAILGNKNRARYYKNQEVKFAADIL